MKRLSLSRRHSPVGADHGEFRCSYRLTLVAIGFRILIVYCYSNLSGNFPSEALLMFYLGLLQSHFELYGFVSNFGVGGMCY